MTMHLEARRRQMHMDRVCEARRRMALTAAAELTSQTQSDCSYTLTDAAAQPDLGLSHHNQYITAWSSPPSAALSYHDHSRQGPIQGRSWQTLNQDMRLRQNILSSQNSPASNINCKCDQC